MCLLTIFRNPAETRPAIYNCIDMDWSLLIFVWKHTTIPIECLELCQQILVGKINESRFTHLGTVARARF